MSAHKQRGLSLLELAVVVTIASVLAAVAIPSLRQQLLDNQVTAQSSAIVGALSMARMEAASRNAVVTLCPVAADDTTKCEAGSLDWSRGWVVFTDADGVLGQRDASDEVLQIFPALQTGMSLGSDGAFISFAGTGTLASAAIKLELRRVPCAGAENRDIIIRLGGHPFVKQASC